MPPLAGLLGQFGVPALSAFVNLDGSDPAVLGAVIRAKRKRAAQHMILDLAENFLFLATVLGACAFGVAWLARDAAHRRLALLPPARLTRLYAGALVGPPLAAAWVVCAAMLPTCWLGEHDF